MRQGAAAPGARIHHVLLSIRFPLLMPRVFLHGPRWREFLMSYRTNTGRLAHHPRLYDFTDDVRELVMERIRFNVDAMWSDPRERLPLAPLSKRARKREVRNG